MSSNIGHFVMKLKNKDATSFFQILNSGFSTSSQCPNTGTKEKSLQRKARRIARNRIRITSTKLSSTLCLRKKKQKEKQSIPLAMPLSGIAEAQKFGDELERFACFTGEEIPFSWYDDPLGDVLSLVVPHRAIVPDVALWATVFIQGLCDFAKGKPEAREWETLDDKETPGTFRWFIELFALDEQLVRSRIRTEEFKAWVSSRGTRKVLLHYETRRRNNEDD